MNPIKQAALTAVFFALCHTAAASDGLEAFKQSKKVIVDTSAAKLCFADKGDCHNVLIGKTTPKGRFDLTIYRTDSPGYGGDVIAFKEEPDFLYALHRVWNGKPSERRNERIASKNVADRIMTNGCINVSDSVYERLKQYFVLEVV
ncbi:murein L,D-transpeptidase [Neisseria sp.]|uniref:murein L,D-transpeptidase n=1 Tax=Neisseria sp. TaxID=192066 RepID=UPI0035A101FD